MLVLGLVMKTSLCGFFALWLGGMVALLFLLFLLDLTVGCSARQILCVCHLTAGCFGSTGPSRCCVVQPTAMVFARLVWCEQMQPPVG